MFLFIMELFRKPKFVAGDIWVKKDNNPFMTDKICIVDAKKGFVLFYFTVIDGKPIGYKRQLSADEGFIRSLYKPEQGDKK
jgi:hypothetical protein